MTPIEKIMNSLDWEPVERQDAVPDDMPYVTHVGKLDIGGNLMKCYQLSNGQRIIDADDINSFFGS